MKKLTAILLLIFLAVSMVGCTQEKELTDPVRFHYLQAPQTDGELPHGTADSVIAPEVREGAEYRHDLELMLDIYLHGPLDKDYLSPYPVGTTLRQFAVEDSGATVVLSNHFASLSGLDLTLACGCLAMTVMDLTGAESVTIRTEGTLSADTDSITMTRDDLVLFDTATPETD